jgi:hypothetical protein
MQRHPSGAMRRKYHQLPGEFSMHLKSGTQTALGSMKFSLIASAVAAALGSQAAPANEAKPGTVPGTTPNYVIYAAGGSAEVNPVFVAACRILQNVDSYTDTGTTADSASYRVFYGDLIAAQTYGSATAAAGSHVMIIYKFNGGAYANGIVPQTAAGATVVYPLESDILNGTLLAGATQGTACTTGKPTYGYTNSVTPATAQQPDWGASDLEATIFVGPENNPTYPAINAVVQNHDLLYDAVEGVAVTANLYANKTNFSKAEVAGILAGFYTDWSQLYGDNGSPLAAGGIVLIDRNVGSALKAAGNQFFLGFPGLGANALAPESLTYAPYTQTTLPTSEVQSDVIVTSTTTQATDLKSLNQSNIRAISVLSMDTPPALNQTHSGTNDYDFVKIDGTAVDTGGASDNINGSVKTTYINAITGNYEFFYQPNFNYRNAWFNGTTGNTAIGRALLAVFQSSNFSGAASGLPFPAAAIGTLTDADRAASVTLGVTTDSRNGTSTGILYPLFNAGTSAIPTNGDPL